MKVTFLNYRKYKMTRMPFKFYLPRLERYWGGKIWSFTIFRDYGIQFDFRKGNLIDWLNQDKWRNILRFRKN